MQLPVTSLERHDSAIGWWEMARRDPDPRLRPYVRAYTGYEERTPASFRRREVPFGGVVMIISFGPELLLLDPEYPQRPAQRHVSFVAGLDDAVTVTEHPGVSHGIQVDFTPLGAYMFFGLPMDELARRVVDLESAMGSDAPRIVERLHETPTWDARFRLLDGMIAARLADARAPSPGVAWAWGRLDGTGGTVPVGPLAEQLGWSQRRLIRRFREQVGLPPKLLARVLRFHRAVGLLRRDDGSRWAQIATECGYYDQAHFNRDFRDLAGTAPGEFMARQLPGGGGVSGH